MPALRTASDSVGTLPEGYVFDEDGAIVPVSGDFVETVHDLGIDYTAVVFA